MATYTYAIQTIDTQRGETDWRTNPPIRQTEQEPDLTGDEVARWLVERKHLAFLASVRGRIAVWRGDRECGTFGEGLGNPDGTHEVTKEN